MTITLVKCPAIPWVHLQQNGSLGPCLSWTCQGSRGLGGCLVVVFGGAHGQSHCMCPSTWLGFGRRTLGVGRLRSRRSYHSGFHCRVAKRAAVDAHWRPPPQRFFSRVEVGSEPMFRVTLGALRLEELPSFAVTVWNSRGSGHHRASACSSHAPLTAATQVPRARFLPKKPPWGGGSHGVSGHRWAVDAGPRPGRHASP
jgi:hypothetical protein